MRVFTYNNQKTKFSGYGFRKFKKIKNIKKKRMKKSLKDQLNAFIAFKQFCEENKIVWENTAAFLNAFGAFVTKIESIFSTEAEQEENNKGVTRSKDEKKLQLTTLAMSVGQAVQGYAIANNNPELFEKMNISPSDIYRAKASTAISKAQLIFATASDLPQAEIEPYGITAAVLNSLKGAISIFEVACSSTRLMVTHKTILTDDLTDLVGEANTIMRKQLLKIGYQYKATYPNFYEGMKLNSKVIRTTVHTKLKLTAVDSETQRALTGVLAEIEGTALKGVTDMEGKCTITEVPEGKHNVILRKTDYEVAVIDGVDFKRGKSATVNAAMIEKVGANRSKGIREKVLSSK